MEPQKALITVNDDGTITLPNWAAKAILKKSGLRTRKKRIVNKVIKKEFNRLLSDYLVFMDNKPADLSWEDYISGVSSVLRRDIT